MQQWNRWLRQRPAALAWALCLTVVVLGAFAFPQDSSQLRVRAAANSVPAADPLLRSLYGTVAAPRRAPAATPPAPPAPADAAVLSYLAAHQGYRPERPPQTWEGFAREARERVQALGWGR